MYKVKNHKKFSNAYFIRLKNWFNFLHEAKEMPEIVEQQMKMILEDYLKRVYLPLQRYQL